ncbi:MAG: RDD family protein [Actinomycetia bacterium]|nr:RDD family protein [Actinomycetes bacterium]
MSQQGGYVGVDGSGLVTGEAVIVDLRLAKVPSRSLAFLIDLILQVIALIAIAFSVGVVASVTDDVLAFVYFFVASIAVIVGYPATMETLTRGRTVGKLALGLRAVRSDGGAIRFRHALVRALVAVVEIYLCWGAIAVITSLLSPEGKRVGDYAAGTVVIRERAPKPARNDSLPWIPASLQPWAATLDLSHLKAATALSARQFLSRASSLNTPARGSIGRSLANEVASQVSPPPPAGASAELFLNVVLAERSRRAQAGEPSSPGTLAATAQPATAHPQQTASNMPRPAPVAPETPNTNDGFAVPS